MAQSSFWACVFASAMVISTRPVCAARVTPVQQVIAMLNDMKAKGTTAMEVEKKVFAEYAEWVDDRVRDLGFDIKTGQSNIEEHVAFIEKSENAIAILRREIKELDSEIATLSGDKQAATSQRSEDNEEFLKQQEDYAESVDALARAIQVLKSQSHDRPQAELLLQKMATSVPGMRRVLAAFIEEKSKKVMGAPEVAAYEFQSSGIVEVLEGLLDKFKTQLSDLETEESNAAHNFDLEVLHLSNTISKLNSDREEKASVKAKTSEASAHAKGQLTIAKKDLADDQAALGETNSVFATKKRAFEQNQQVRAEEIEAIAKAVEIISDPTVAQSYGKHINLAQVPSFLQRSRASASRAVAREQAAALLRERALATSSKVLASVAAAAVANPFAKVVEMIEDLLAKLKEEAAAEADHKAWCDEQLNKNKVKRDKQTAAVGRLTAEIQQMGAEIQDMADQIAKLSEEQAALTKSMAEATTFRGKEKAENEATIKDAQAAQQAVKQALVILREFYSAQGGAFLQAKRQVPEMAAYKGMQNAKGGVVGMLEVIESDFARLEAETTASEDSAAREYSTFMSESRASNKRKHEEEVKLRLEKDQGEFEQGRKKDDLEAEEDQLAKANAYYEDLKPSCLEVKVNYEDRARMRQEELKALREAYKILDSKSA